jgi:hypothetical protein
LNGVKALKSEAIQHWKVNDLMRRLEIPRYSAIGILECLWQFTKARASRGDIGKVSDEVIATAVFWIPESGHMAEPDREAAAHRLIEALVGARFLDADNAHRLLIHAWPEHCEDSVHMSLARSGQLFADGTFPKLGRMNDDDKLRIVQGFKDKGVEIPVWVKRLVRGKKKPRTPNARRAHTKRTTQPNPAQPSHAKPAPLPSHTHAGPNGGLGGGSAALMGAGGLGAAGEAILRAANVQPDMDSRAGKVKSMLKHLGVSTRVQNELCDRHDITPEVVRQTVHKLNGAGNVNDLPSVLVKRLREHKS